jgi:hypothetical protein
MVEPSVARAENAGAGSPGFRDRTGSFAMEPEANTYLRKGKSAHIEMPGTQIEVSASMRPIGFAAV